jgi:hypothetical protein
MKEYAIWGIPKGETEQALLVAMPNGKPITEKSKVESYVKTLESVGCTAIKVQELDMTQEGVDNLARIWAGKRPKVS